MIWRKTADQLQAEGFQQLEACEYEKAIRTGEKLKRMRHSSAFEILATAYAEDGDLTKAIQELEAGTEQAPGVWRLWQLLGNYYSDGERFRDAKGAYERALSCPECDAGSVRLNQAIVMDRALEHEAALRVLEQVTDEALRVRVASVKVGALNNLGRYGEAIRFAEQVLEASASNPEDDDGLSGIYSGLGRAVWFQERQVERAMELAWKAIELCMTNNSALWLIREVRNQRTPNSQYFRLTVHGTCHEPNEDDSQTEGFYRGFDVVADTEHAALDFAREFEPEQVRPTMTLDECEVIEPAPDLPHGVYNITGAVFYSETENGS